jgi:protein-tyrosine-phosphatase/DNA-binding HxlR family transcriptional regulator
MTVEKVPAVVERASLYRALGDETRLAIIDALWTGDRTPAQLRGETGLQSNLVTFHLDVLEQAGLISRRGSQGDGRRRYVTLEPLAVPFVAPVTPLTVECVLFVCTHNAARSQFAAALWRRRTGGDAVSAGTQPAARVHPHAVAVAAGHGLDLSGAQPRHLADVDVTPDLVISVCDRANEAGLFDAAHRHWSIPDPLGSDRQSFEAAYRAIADRIDRLATERAA